MVAFLTIAAIIILVYILISHFIFKRKLNIKEKNIHPFSKDRTKLFVTAEIIASIAYVVIAIVFIKIADPTHIYPTFMLKITFVLLFIVEVIRGLEIWKFNREEKTYYYQSLSAVMYLIMFFISYLL